MKKELLLLILAFIFISLIGCGKSPSAINSNTFNEDTAISMVIKDHPDFPGNPTDTLTKKMPTGGPVGTSANVKYSTKVEKSTVSRYVVTLIKDWGINVNGKYAKSSWKYKVTQNNVTLIESIDNDYLPMLMK